jgi:hypothetical protein
MGFAIPPPYLYFNAIPGEASEEAFAGVFDGAAGGCRGFRETLNTT